MFILLVFGFRSLVFAVGDLKDGAYNQKNQDQRPKTKGHLYKERQTTLAIACLYLSLSHL